MRPPFAATLKVVVIGTNGHDAERRKIERKAERQIVAVLNEQLGRVMAQAQFGTEQVSGEFWRREAPLMAAALLPIIAIVVKKALEFAVADLAQTVHVGVDPASLQGTLTKWARQYTYGLIKGIDKTTREAVSQVMQSWIVTGGPLSELSKSLEPTFGKVRARMIAATETTRAFAQAHHETWKQSGVIVAREWRTAMDERVCFPRNTLIQTAGGLQPIERVRIGQKVLTRKGYKPVIAVNRRWYNGDLITLRHEGGLLTCTADHPIWTLEKGWLEASDITASDSLQTVDNQSSSVLGSVQFNVSDSHDVPTASLQKAGLALITGGILMPISAVDFQSDAKFRQQEVNAVPADLCFLDVLDIRSVKNMTDTLLWEGLSLKSSIAGEAAKLAISIARRASEFFAAIAAIDVTRRAAAFLRTKVASIPLLAYKKQLAAALTSLIFDIRKSAFATAHSVPMSYAGADIKTPTTDRAYFDNKNGFPELVIADMTTETTTFSNLTGLHVGQLITDRAGYHLPRLSGSMVTLSGAIDLLRLSGRKFFAALWTGFQGHTVPLWSFLSRLYHRLSDIANHGMWVYNLQVEGDPVFFANGVLVHNCPICNALDGQQADLGKPFEGGVEDPPAHVSCRCWTVPVIPELVR